MAKMVANQQEFNERLLYVAAEARAVLHEHTGHLLPMESVRLFAQSEAEYITLNTLTIALGHLSVKQPAAGLYVDCTLQLGAETVHKVGIRPPDPERPQAGHADFVTPDFPGFVATYHHPESGLTQLVPGREDSLFELRSPHHPKVLVYIIPARP